MNTTTPFQQPPQTVRRLVVDVVDARNLLPKDGQGSSSPYVIADFDGQRKRTTTRFKELTTRFGTSPSSSSSLTLITWSLRSSSFSARGEEALVYYTLEKRSVFSWIRGEIGLRIYYYDELLQEDDKQQQQPPPPPQEEQPPGTEQERNNRPPGMMMVEEGRVFEVPRPMEHCVPLPEGPPHSPPRVVVVEESPPPVVHVQQEPTLPEMCGPPAPEMQFHPERPNGDYSPKDISGKKTSVETERVHPFDLVEPMQYLFVRIVKARGIAPPSDSPYVKVRTSSHYVRSKPASFRPNESNDSPEWNQVFALGYNKTDANSATLEISVWDSPTENFLGGVCFDLSDVPVRDPPDSPLAPQWYRLEGGAADQNPGRVSGDIQLSVWIGTQSDDAFPEAWSSDAPYVAHTRSKVYQSPKLWYLRVQIIEAQDLNITPNLPPLTAPEIQVKDLLFVAGEPLEDSMILLVEDRTTKEPALLGHVVIPLSSIEQRIDERHVAAKWFTLDGGSYCGRVYLRLCLEGGYHVLDEAAHVCSDFRPTAKQLWKPPVGILELGILGARGLLPMKSKGPGKGSTDAYCVAKESTHTLSTLESNKVYTSSYPLLVLTRTGLKKMGEIELAVRFACPSLLPDTCAVYGQPLLPQNALSPPARGGTAGSSARCRHEDVAQWLARSEPPLGHEVVRYMLDADSHTWSMRKSKANWFRIVAVLAWAVGLAKWLDDIRRWKNPVTTVLLHILYLVLVWYPDLIVPTGFLYVVLIGIWYYRFRPKIPAGMDTRLSQAEAVDPDELDEEFDTMPSSKPPDLIRVRYDRLRMLAARVQTVLGDFATQGERVQALVSWRDPRATKLFIGVCLAITITLYSVPPKMVAVALGFYYLRHPMFRNPMPPASLNFFRRLPSLSDRLM
ncbi:Phosphoribosyltransferase C-terminal [Sesbania bispinosa]|nr:Phosphoribosyltransferase C-terminal [Sesbania bispinosa]